MATGPAPQDQPPATAPEDLERHAISLLGELHRTFDAIGISDPVKAKLGDVGDDLLDHVSNRIITRQRARRAELDR
jgi:hypothetical protein